MKISSNGSSISVDYRRTGQRVPLPHRSSESLFLGQISEKKKTMFAERTNSFLGQERLTVAFILILIRSNCSDSKADSKR